MPVAQRRLAEHLGPMTVEPVTVVLSDAATHAARFPPTLEELVRVLGPGPAEEARQDPEGFSATYARSTYALGVATRTPPTQHQVAGVASGELTIYVDVETIEQRAGEMAVDVQSLLAAVLAHELAHCRRGHADIGLASPTHGWLEEGDAQRDAWQVLTSLLADEGWAAVAYEGRAAQLRLANDQPPAYQQFAAGSSERAALGGTVALPERGTWLLQPARAVFRLVAQGAVEVPALRSDDGETPRVGDRVYLHDAEMLAGPWTLVALADQPVVGLAPDVASARARWRSAMWWQLQPGRQLWAVPPDEDGRRADALVPVKVDFTPAAWHLGQDAMELATTIAARVREERRADMIATFGEEALQNRRFRAALDTVDGWSD